MLHATRSETNFKTKRGTEFPGKVLRMAGPSGRAV